MDALAAQQAMQDQSRARVGAAASTAHLQSKSGGGSSISTDTHSVAWPNSPIAVQTTATADGLPSASSSKLVIDTRSLRRSIKRKASPGALSFDASSTVPALEIGNDLASPLLSRSTRRKINIDKVANKHTHSYSLDWKTHHPLPLVSPPAASLPPVEIYPAAFPQETSPESAFKPMPQLSFSPSILFSAVPPPTPSSLLSAIPSSHIGTFSPLQNHSIATSQQSNSASIPAFPYSSDMPHTDFGGNDENDPFSATLLTAGMYTTLDGAVVAAAAASSSCSSSCIDVSPVAFRNSDSTTMPTSASMTISLPIEYMFSPSRANYLTPQQIANPAFFDGMIPLKEKCLPPSSSLTQQLHSTEQVFELNDQLPDEIQPIFPSNGVTVPSKLANTIALHWHAANVPCTPTKPSSGNNKGKEDNKQKNTREENLELFASQVRRGIENASLRDSVRKSVAAKPKSNKENVGLGIFGILPPLPTPLPQSLVFPTDDGLSRSTSQQQVTMQERDITFNSRYDGDESVQRHTSSINPSASWDLTDAPSKQGPQGDATLCRSDTPSPLEMTVAGLPNIYHTPIETFTELAQGSAKYRTMPSTKPQRIRPPRNHNKKRADGAPPRPPNAWILYRSSRWEDDNFREACRGMAQKDVSKYIADLWRKESTDVRDHFDDLADLRKREHEMRYPGYTYQPNRGRMADRANLPTTRVDTYASMQSEDGTQPSTMLIRTNTAPARLNDTSQLAKPRIRSRSAKRNKVRSSSARNADASDASEMEYVQCDHDEDIDKDSKNISRSTSRQSPSMPLGHAPLLVNRSSKSSTAMSTKQPAIIASATPTPARTASPTSHKACIPRYQQPTIASIAKKQSRKTAQSPNPAMVHSTVLSSTAQPTVMPQFSASVHAPTPTRSQFMHTQNDYQSLSQILVDAPEMPSTFNLAMWTPYLDTNVSSFNWTSIPASQSANLFTPNSSEKRTLPAAPTTFTGDRNLPSSTSTMPSLARSLSTQPSEAMKQTQLSSPQMTRSQSSPAQVTAQIPAPHHFQDGMIIGGIFYPFTTSLPLGPSQESYIVLQDATQASEMAISQSSKGFISALPDGNTNQYWTEASAQTQAMSRDLTTSLSAASSLNYLPNTPGESDPVEFFYEDDMNTLQAYANGLDPSLTFMQLQQSK